MDMTAFETAEARPSDIGGAPLAPAQLGPAWLTPRLLDRIEQVLIVGLWVWLAHRSYVSWMSDRNAFAPLLPISECAVLVFVLIRRPTEAISRDLGAWILAITATSAPLLIQPGYDMFPKLAPVGVALLAIGNFFQMTAKLSLRRSFGIAPANRGVKITGLYRFVRHPMYAGYLLTHIAILMLMPSPLNLTIYAIGWAAQVRRMLAEEALLGQDPVYRDYAARVRWRLIPGLF